MSEIMRPIPFEDLINWVQQEYKNHSSVFGIRENKFFRPDASIPNRIELFGKAINSPIGPAAGPHTQLAPNILAAYLAGSRFIELKTVQTMDGEELRKAVARPCINAVDEGYNVEWSTELTVAEAREEYINAWFLCHVFAKEFQIADKGDFVSDLIFNMSAGYSLEGIKSAKIDSYIEGMKNAGDTEEWKRCYNFLADNVSSFKHFTKSDLEKIPLAVSNNITLSTLHGCPREEIEKIAAYLITEKGLHTYIKCNPTLLGYEDARRLLDKMGYDYVSFDGHHFKNDLQFADAVEMLGRLKKLASERGLQFGVKLTNTFPVEIKRNELPGNEMYMSGRALFPLSINVAKKLSDVFNGGLPISYSGGADYFNLKDILETGIRPVTLATTILKPGGYERLTQLAELAVMGTPQNSSHGEHGGDGEHGDKEEEGRVNVINVKALTALAESLTRRKRYHKEYRQVGSRKPTRGMDAAVSSHFSLLTAHFSLPLFDCFKAPCVDNGCPIHQKIPDYLSAVAAGNYMEAFRIIAKDNTAPSITGTLCNHECQNVCTRVDYEDPLHIRAAKLIAADEAQEAYTASLAAAELKTEKSVAVVGAGPAGIAVAVFLRRNGVPVTVYEKRDRPFGIIQHIVPAFRISDEKVFRDFQMAVKIGVDFVFNSPVSSVAELQKKHSFIVIATGAYKEGESPVKQGGEKVIDALRFLEDSRKSKYSLELGENVAVIGGGDVAMDCARAAKRNRGVGSVAIVYRRTREFMPSQHEEQELALADGVEIMELLASEVFSDGKLTCEIMRLGDYDDSGRRKVTGTGEKRELSFNTVIGAVGANVDAGYFSRSGIALNAKGLPDVGGSGECSISGVYAVGDCKAGAATIVKAIADGKAAAADILAKLGLSADFAIEAAKSELGMQPDMQDLYLKKGVVSEAKQDNTDAYRCLSCNTLCEICADVCPNRANVMVEVKNGNQIAHHQIVHIDRMCNECGNCATFCPWAGKPYREKPTVFSSEEDFDESENPGFFRTGSDVYKIRLEDKSVVNYHAGDTNVPGEWIAMIETIETQYGYLL